MSQFPKIQFLTLRFCPFAHRARLALEALQIPYDLVEVIHLPEGATEYKKDALLLEHNPQGLVPVLIVKFPDGKEETVTESLYCVEYLDKLAEKYGLKAAPLLPRDDEAEKKRLIETADKYGSAIGAFYKPFMTNDKDALGPLVEELKKFSDEVKGPFFTGKDLSIVDIAIYPAVSRLSLLRQLRGPDFEVSVEKYPQLGPLFEWFKNVSELDAAKKADESEDYLTTMNRRYLRMRGAVGYTA